MQNHRNGWRLIPVTLALHTMPVLATNGHILHGVGPINQSMGGAGIATSIDAIGSNHNNVSSISFLDTSSIEFALELFIPNRSFSGTVNGGPSGTVDSKTREAILPSFGLVYKTQGPWAFGFSAMGISGFGVDYPANNPNPGGNFNPLALPQSMGGFGAVYSNCQMMQLTPSVAYQLTPDLSLGVGVNVDWAAMVVDPWPGTTPNASGFPTGTHAASTWGWGVTVGATYRLLDQLKLGLVFKSPQWFGSFSWNSQYPDGTPANFRFRLDYPMIIGGGLSYQPVEPLLLALDVKWINYSGTKGFEQKNWAMTASGPFVQGFGWRDIWTVSLGAQYKVTPAFAVRAGYNYGGSPISSGQQFFNVFAPAIVRHHLTAGAGYELTRRLGLNVSYYHAFSAEQSGTFISDGTGMVPINQPIPGTQVTNRLHENSIAMQVTYKF
ncbi:outer membrane protein transport protein [Nitrosomonas sp.]|uniref:OmpP1/FadL family transporter n=1 Tax=Nitrosomonas sp. TaxID=42353 RepID=UPI0025D962CA|nr:outer membrane protein transport protein [Nitrosomonas sp.]MCC6917513.1 outer membrane protein transport protein [Nitrosomonas sp.]